MSTPDLHKLAAAISNSSPAIKTFANAVADVLQPPTVPAIPTGGYYVENTADLAVVASAGWSFAHTVLQPGDTAGMDTWCGACKAKSLRPVVGLYPYPYTYSNGWTLTQAGLLSVTHLATAWPGAILFVFNEPYQLSFTATQLYTLQSKIKSVAANLLTWTDIGQPSEYAPTQGTQKGIADYVGVWRYPFTSAGYNKTYALQTLAAEVPFVHSMGAKAVWLMQTLAEPSASPPFVFPTLAQYQDFNHAVRSSTTPPDLIACYTWDRISDYTDSLSAHPNYLSSTV